MESFLKSDSRYKAARGGKGVGRFSWLKVYKEVNISSIYKNNDEFYERKFCFSLTSNEIDDTAIHLNEPKEVGTLVKLENPLSPYKKYIPKNTDEIAHKIIEHCLVYFLSDKCPKITIADVFENKFLVLNDLLRENIIIESNKEIFNVFNESFNLLNIKVRAQYASGNKLYFCANNRLVEEIDLKKYIIDLSEKINAEQEFYYIGVITGNYLDDNVDMNRLSFNIPKKDDPTLIHEISAEKIMNNVCEKVKIYLDEYLTPIHKEKYEKIQAYIKTEAPQFRHLLKYKKDEISKIPPNCPPDKLDEMLYIIKRNYDVEIKRENNLLLSQLKNSSLNEDEYKKKFNNQVAKIADGNKSTLAEYIAHRRIIIDLLKKALRIQTNDKFVKEEYIHNLIYPMKTTADDIDYEYHNLWLIDEKLAYCNYIASDLPLQPKDKRPDIMLLDNPIAVTDTDEPGPYNTIVIFELKRPMRDDYTEVENPTRQLVEYAVKLRAGEAKDKYGRLIKVNENTKFYLYAICDVTKKLEELLLNIEDFNQTPDKTGYFTYKTNLKAYIEVIPFDKLVNDAEKRNRVLFDKLGI